MKIGILTITPNIGFGGNLQAYALKSVLESLGHEINIIQYRPKWSVRARIKFFLQSLYKIVVKTQFAKFTPEGSYKYICRNIRTFHDEKLAFSKPINSSYKLHQYINNNYDCIVVGSDQVWRPKYVAGIHDYYLAGIKKNIKKIAYATSFGVSDWEYTKHQTEYCTQLIQSFEYVSVREKSGINLILSNLKYTKPIYCDLDPTLLASSKIYESLIVRNNINSNYIFSYILDKSKDKEYFCEILQKKYHYDLLQFNTNAEHASEPLKRRIAPSIEEWITGIYYAKFVVTDSFHGCVFSLIFNKPFVVYVNKERGEERFLSILGSLGLTNRIFYNSESFRERLLEETIDWENINKIIRFEREKIIARLRLILNENQP